MDFILQNLKRGNISKLSCSFKKVNRIMLIMALGVFLYSNISTAEDKKLDIVRQVLEKSGAKQQISEIPQVVQALLPAQMAVYNASDSSEISEFIMNNLATYYSGNEIFKRVEKHFLENYKKKYFDRIMNWLETDLGKRIVKMEVVASTPEAATAILSYSLQLQSSPPEKKRMEMIETLIEVIEIDKRFSSKMEAIYMRMMKGVNSSLPEDRRIEDEELEIVKKSLLETLSGQMNSFLLSTYLYTYQELSNEELEKYIDFLSEKSSKWFNRNLFDIMLAAIEDGSERFGVDLGKKIAKIELEKREERKWKEYNVEDTKYSIDFPGKPEYDVQTFTTESGTLELKIFGVGFDEMAYMFMWIQKHPVLAQKLMGPEELLTEAMMGSAMSVSGQVLENNFVNIQGYTGIDFKVAFMGGQALMESMLVIVDGDLVQIMMNGLTRDVVNKENDRFFNSFEIKK